MVKKPSVTKPTLEEKHKAGIRKKIMIGSIIIVTIAIILSLSYYILKSVT